MWAALTLALGLPNAHAQTVPDGATHTNVIAAPNGTPVVNIAAPNNAGVSHNTYQQFNVSSNGLILNNSGAISNTQLAGYITGNPNLGAGQSASIILNEVTSTQPSQLNGAMEVAGRAAQVIVANPNGITCGGCGFINAPRGTLVTGVPILDANGGLSGFNVTGGTINVNTQGLLSGNTDQVDLLARAVQINAGVWARQLNVVTGANRIDYATLATQPLSATGATPAVALDVSALGGMYANAIRLIGTEAGLGVNSQGQIAAQNGDLTITSAGQVVLGGKTTATGNLTISAAQALNNQGTLAAGGVVTLAGSDLFNSGTLYSGSAMTLSASGQLLNSGAIEAQNGALNAQAGGALSNTGAASVYAGGAINLTAASLDNAGTVETAQGATLQIGGNASNSGTLQTDAGALAFTANTLTNSGTLSANGSAMLNAADNLASSGKLLAAGNLALTSAQLTTSGTVQAGGALDLNGGSLNNSGKLYALGGAWTATLSGAFTNQAGGDVYGSQNLSLNAAALTNAGGIEAQAAALTLGGAFANSGKLQTDQADLALTATTFANSGTLSAYRTLQAQLSGSAQNSGVLVSGQALNVSAGSFDNQAGGQVQSGTDLSFAAATLSNEGGVNAKGNATLSGTSLSNGAGAQWIAAGTLVLNQTGSVSNAGVLQAGSDLSLLHAISLSNATNATVYAGQDFNLGVSQLLNNAGMLYAARTATFNAGSVTNSGTLRSAGTLTLDSAGSVGSSGAIQAQQNLTLQSGGDFSNSGELYAIGGNLVAQIGGAFTSSSGGDIFGGQNVSFNAGSFGNAGTLEAKQAVTLTAQGSATNSGTVQADSGSLAMTANTLTNQGTLSAAGAMQLSSTGNFGNSGNVATVQTLALSASNLTNSGQIQSGGNATLQVATLTNSKLLQAGGALALQNNATLTNQAGATILAGGNLSADTASLLDNAGTIQSSGNLVIDGAGAVTNRNGGTLYGTQLTTLQLGGALSNAGTVYGVQGFNLDAASLSNSGSLRSDASLAITTQGDATNNGTAYALGVTNWHIGGALSNNGVLAAGGNTTLTANSLSGSGTLAAGLRSDGTLGTAGDLAVTTSGNLTDNGHALAAGMLDFSGSAIDLSSSQTRANSIALTATQGNISNAGGDLAANGAVTLTTPGSLINGGASSSQGGKISAGTLVVHASALDNRYGSLVQTGTGDLSLAFGGAFQNANGSLSTNAQNLSINAASIDNSGGTIQDAGTGTLTLVTPGNLANSNGKIAANGALSLQTNATLGNDSGTLSAAGNVTAKAGSFSNVHGTLIGNNVGLTVAQALTNTNSGTIQAAGNLTASANTLDNSGGAIKLTSAQLLNLIVNAALTNGAGGFIGGNGAATILAGSLTNAGQIYAATTLGVTAQGSLTNDGGALQALGSSSIGSGGALSNRGGSIEAGSGSSNATLSINAASLDDTNGRVANTGQGNTTVSLSQNLVNEGGTLGGQGAATLSASNLDNNAGKLVSGQALTLNLGGMSNNGGTVYAGSDLNWNNGGASLTNAQGSLQAGGNLSFSLASLDNTNGTLASNGSGNLTLGSFTGAGKVAAGQNLSISVSGDYSNAVGNQLSANNNLTLNVGGNFSNAAGATLQAPNTLTVSAANIDNAGGATFNSANTTLSTGGTLSNEGNIEGDTITLNAGALNNTANIIGGTITATAGSLTNGADLGQATGNNAYQSALIAGSNSIALYVGGTLLNRDATIFSVGDITIGANAGGGASQAVTNLSGDIEANGSVTINANQFTNQRRVFQTTTYNLIGSEQSQNTNTGAPQAVYRYDDPDPTHKPPYVAASQVLTPQQQAALETWCGGQGTPGKDGDQWCNGTSINGDSHNILHNDLQSITTATLTAVQRLSAASAEGRLLAGGNITLNGSVLNDKSTIAAGNNLIINGQNGSNGGGSTSNATVQNIAWTPTGTLQESINEQTGIEYVSFSGSRHWAFKDYETWGTYQDSVQVALGSGQPSWITYDAGQSLAATMSAGNTVSITAQTINNTTVGANGQPVQNVIGLGGNSAGHSVNGSGASTVSNVGGNSGGIDNVAVGTAPGQASGNPLTTGTARNVAIGSVASSSASNRSTATPQVVSTLVGPNATVNLPRTGLYSVNVQPGSEFLVETNPQFTQYTKFISSDYMLQKLSFDPHQTEQRLGDGFYEQQLVLDQITQLTGRRYLADASDALDQYRDLMNNAVQVAQQFNLSVGVALTPEQMANLTQDIVWLVSVNVDGHQVLEPVVYLSAADAKNLAASGATIAGKNVVLNASGDITNNGTIAASANAQITAGNLLNSGSISAGNDLSITAAQNILNGGTLKAGGNVSLVAGNDVLSGVNVAQSLGAVQVNGLSSQISAVALNNSSLLGGISAGGSLAINAGRDLTLDTAPVTAGGNLSLAAGRDLTATATAISAGGNAQLLAGRDLSLLATGTTTHTGTQRNGVDALTHTVSTIQAGGGVAMVAGQDLISQGAQLTGSTVSLGAGHDVNLQAVTDSTTRSTDHFQNHTETSTGQTDQTVRGTSITGSNGISVAANHDLTITAGALNSASGNVTLAAGNNLTLAAAQEDHSSYRDTSTHHSGLFSSDSTKTHDATSDTYAVGTNVSGNNVTLAAGNNLTTEAAQLTANNALNLSAVNNVTLGAGEQTHTEEHDYQHSSFNFFSDSSKRFGSVDPEWRSNQSSTTINQTSSIGSTLSGDTVTIAAGHDLTGTAVQIAGTHDVTLAAGNNLTLNAGQDTYTETQSSGTSHTGLMNGGGFSVLIGNKSEKTTFTDKEVSYTGSLVGSTDGAVTLTAGNNVHITGSDVLSQTATTIVGKNVTIDAAVGSQDVTQTHKESQGGISVGLSGGVASTAQTLAADVHGASSSSSDSRLKALYAMQAAQTLFSPGAGKAMNLGTNPDGSQQTGLGALENTPQALQQGYAQGAADTNGEMGGGVAGGAQGAGKATGISLHIGIGGGSSTSTSKTHDDVTYGSKINSNGNVTIAATGGDLNVIGSQINGKNVALSATNNINLLSQAEQHTDSNSSHNASGEVGFSIGQTTGIYLSVAAGEAIAHGNGTTHTDSVVNAKDTLTLLSGNDTTIKGAQATGNTVLADIGGNLNIASEQDTNDYASHSIQGGLTLVYGWSGSGVGVSGNLALSKANSNYASVTQMSGIGAGNGGFDITVGGNTDLKGAVIASSAGADKNILDTGSLTYSNIQNQAKSSAESISVGGGVGTGSMSGMSGFSGGIGIPQNSNQSSTTQAGIAQGTIVTRDNPNQDLSGLNRNPSLSDANGLTNKFDPNKIAQNQQAGILAGQIGMVAAGDLEKATNATSTESTAIHAVVGAGVAALGGGNALQGALGAGASEAVSGTMGDYLANQGIDPNGASGQVLMNLGSTLIGGAVGGGAGAATALYGNEFNRQLHPGEQQVAQTLAAKSNGLYTTQQIEDAMRLSGYSLGEGSVMPGETAQEGTFVSVKDSGSIYDTHASWLPVNGPGGNQYLLQQYPSQVDPDLAAYITANTGGVNSPYAWSPEQKGMSEGAAQVQALSDWYSSNHVGTRALGGLQMVGGELEAVGGLAAAMTCETGFGCAASAYLTGAGLDNATAGANMLGTGQSAATLGQQGLQVLGLSPNAASLTYGATQLVPAGVEAYTLNAATNTQIATNAAIRATYAASGELGDIQASLTQQVGGLRAALTGDARTSGNIGVAQINIPGIQTMMAASSQIEAPTEAQQALGFVGGVEETFPSTVVPTATGFPLLRSGDSEAVILNNIAAQLGDNTSASGTINLLTERPPCDSCSNIIQMFQNKYPNIKINVMNNGGVVKPVPKVN